MTRDAQINPQLRAPRCTINLGSSMGYPRVELASATAATRWMQRHGPSATNLSHARPPEGRASKPLVLANQWIHPPVVALPRPLRLPGGVPPTSSLSASAASLSSASLACVERGIMESPHAQPFTINLVIFVS